MRISFAIAALLPLLIGCQSTPPTATTATRPPLPPAATEKFSVALPAAVDGRDSVNLLPALQPVAEAYYRFNLDLLDRYAVPDTLQQVMLHECAAIAALALGKLPEFEQHWRQRLALRPGPAYRTPPGLDWQTWATAQRQVPNQDDPKFAAALTAAWRATADSLAPRFRADILNGLKGGYAPNSPRVQLQNTRDAIEQARQTRAPLNFNTAYDLLFNALNYDLKRRHRATVEAALFALEPARVVEEPVRIPLRDGIRLSGLVYRNAARPATERVPVLVSLSPYPGGDEGQRGNVFATNGYVYLYVDTRGRRGSEGNFFPYEHDARDYYDIIDWASKQPWCDGQVATTGGSYLGFDQWQAIRKGFRHPALKAINPMAAVGFGVDFPRESNIFYPYILQWATLVSGKNLNDALFYDTKFWDNVGWKLYKNHLPFAKLDSVAGLPNPYFQKWVSHPDFDGYWRGILPSDDDYRALDLPVLTTTGYFDGDQNGALFYYRHHQRLNPKAAQTHQLLIGPFDHGGSQWAPGASQGGLPLEAAAQIPIYKQVIEWFDWRLKKAAQPAWVLGPVTYYQTGYGRWRGAPSLAAMTADTFRLYLSPAKTASRRRPAGLLALTTAAPAVEAVIPYRHDVAQVLDSAFLFGQPAPFSDSMYVTSPHNLVFESAPLTRDYCLSGAVLPRLWVRLNVPDADLRVTIYEQTAAGQSYTLATSVLRTRYRHGGETPQVLKPGETVRLDFANQYLYVRRLRKGSRLRFTVEVQNTPYMERNYGFGGAVAHERATGPRPIEVQLLTGGKYASRVELPVAAE